jgi:hypothetical protein
MACALRTPLVAFVLLVFIIAPLLCLALGLCFGAILAAAEGWPVGGSHGGFWYVTTNIAGTPPVGSESPTSTMGITVDIIVSTISLVFASTIIALSGMLAFVGNLPDKLNQFEKHFSRYDLSVLKRSVDLSRNENMTKNDFSLAMLLRLGKIKAKDLERIEEVFFKLDADHSGYLDRADVDDLILKTEKRKEAEAEAEAASPSRPGRGGRVDRDIFEMEDGSGGSTPSANDGNGAAANGNGEGVGGVKNDAEAEGVESTGNPLQLWQTDAAAAGAGGRQDSKDGAAMDDT